MYYHCFSSKFGLVLFFSSLPSDDDDDKYEKNDQKGKQSNKEDDWNEHFWKRNDFKGSLQRLVVKINVWKNQKFINMETFTLSSSFRYIQGLYEYFRDIYYLTYGSVTPWNAQDLRQLSLQLENF